MKNNKMKIIYFAFVFIITFIIFSLVFCLVENRLKFSLLNFLETFKNKNFYLLLFVIVAVEVIVFLCSIKIDADKEVVKTNIGQDDHFLTKREMKKSRDFVVTKLSKLHEEKDGIVLKAKKNKNDIDVVFTTPIHTLIIGTTGSGKTSGILNNTIQVLAHTKTKPSMIITDVKGELFLTHSKSLERLGYTIQVLDLVEPYYSTGWNPFNILKERIDKIKELSYMYGEEDVDVLIKIQILRDEIYEFAKDLTEAICPLDKSNDVTWQKGARSLINAIVLALCEDYEQEFISEQEFCLVTLYKTIVDYATEERIEDLKKYLYFGRKSDSKVKGLAKTVLETQEKTLTSFLSDVNKFTEWLTDTGILSLTSKNDIDFYSFDEKPTALFIKVPDQRQTRHKLVSLFITQMYKTLVEKASENLKEGKTSDAELMRNLYFILDEFGNLPTIPNFHTVITVARSRKIFFEMVIQSYAQLQNKYTKDIADTIKANCNVKIFLGTDDEQTRREISELAGKKKVANVNLSSEHLETFRAGASMKEVPLIYPTELFKLNNSDDFGNAIVLTFGHYSFKSIYTPSFLIENYYGIEKCEIEEKRTANVFIENDYCYNIQKKLDEIESLKDDLEKMKREEETNDERKNDASNGKWVGMEKTNDENLKLKEQIEDLKNIIDTDIYKEIISSDIKTQKKLINNLIEDNKFNLSLVFKLSVIKEMLEKASENLKEGEEKC